MTRYSMTVAVALAAGGLASAQTQVAEDMLKGTPIVLRGCVAEGIDKDTYVMDGVSEVKRDGKIETPKGLANPVIYWFKDASPLEPHVGRMVEIAGRIDGVDKSEFEIKAWTQTDGALVVELEGPGPDVRARLDQLPSIVGTAGRTPEADDVRTAIIRTTIRDVKAIDGDCRRR